jgi:hypothetical protein
MATNHGLFEPTARSTASCGVSGTRYSTGRAGTYFRICRVTQMSWKWNTAPLGWKDKCSMCEQALRVLGDGGIVIWTDSKHYHIGCLLDRLASGGALPQAVTADSVSHWGPVP